MEAYARHSRHHYGQPRGDRPTYADAATWRRWCRVRPVSATTCRLHGAIQAKTGETAVAWLERRGLLLTDGA